MNWLITFICKRQVNAWGLAIATALLPFMGWLSAVTVGVVTLRKGQKQGASVLLASCLPAILAYSLGHLQYGFMLVWCISQAMVFAGSVVLRTTASWQVLLLATTALGSVVVIATYVFVPDIANVWTGVINNAIVHFTAIVDAQDPASVAQLVKFLATFEQHNMAAQLAESLTGLLCFMVLLGALGHIAIARWLQSRVFHPGGFDQELTQLLLPKWLAMGFVAMSVVAMFASAIFVNLWFVLLLSFLFVGFCVLHRNMQARKWAMIWQSLVYVTMALGVPYSFIVLALFGAWESYKRTPLAT